jgi:dynein heavy chain, axonemal
LEFFISIFEKSIEKAPSVFKYERIKNINDKFLRTWFEQIVRSLLEKDKIIFSFLITLRLMLHERKSISSEELRFLMVLPPCSHLPLPPCPPYFTNKQWSILNELANTVIGFHGLEKDFIDNGEQWAKVWENQNLL